MNRQLVFLPEARGDILDAIAWYKNSSPVSGPIWWKPLTGRRSPSLKIHSPSQLSTIAFVAR